MNANPEDLTRKVLSVLCILLLLAGSLWVMRAFIGATVWATMIVVASWPILTFIQARLGGRRGLAVVMMTLGLLLLLVIPLTAAVYTIAQNADQVTAMVERVSETGLPQPPEWVGRLPIVGEKLSATLKGWADSGPEGFQAKLGPYLSSAAMWVLAKAGSFGGTLLQFLLVIIVSAVLYSNGEVAAMGVRRFGRRLAGDHGEESVILAGKAIRSVALGVGVTALVQTVLGAIGLAVAGVPYTSVLSAVMLMLCIAQLGPSLVLFPAVAWMYWTGDNNGWATFLLIWSLVVASLDNVLRPMLIRRGADLPLLLIFAGVIGGLVSFGLIGIFVGPVVLAVTYTLLKAWVEQDAGPARVSASNAAKS